MFLKPATAKEEEREPVDLLSSGLEEELLQREMGHFWTMAVKMRGPISAVAALIPDALFLTFGMLGCFNLAGIPRGLWPGLAYLATALVGFVLSFLLWRMTNVAIIILLRAVYVLVTSLACLVIGTSCLIYVSHSSTYLFPPLINVSVLNGCIWLILGLVTFLAPLLLAYPALHYYLAIMAHGDLS
jgi:hypothetical protein